MPKMKSRTAWSGTATPSRAASARSTRSSTSCSTAWSASARRMRGSFSNCGPSWRASRCDLAPYGRLRLVQLDRLAADAGDGGVAAEIAHHVPMPQTAKERISRTNSSLGEPGAGETAECGEHR